MSNINKILVVLFLLSSGNAICQQIANQDTYLEDIKEKLNVKWPANRTINLVFHGHSVPSGYFKTPIVSTFEAYPFLLHQAVKAIYPYAVINLINTAIGGENSESGAKRFKKEVLNHKPDVLFIDYALNDRRIGLEKAKKSWEKMIKLALKKDIKVILLSPTPDMQVDLKLSNTVLDDHTAQIKKLAEKYEIGFVDSYQLFKTKAVDGENIENYMSQGNHPNHAGHLLVLSELITWF
ncbi:Lysophospholipase L1 [Spirosomataceae bacterium TFI 002]|nr:Lysophospholipase L1 [Spirosomataceae bacterium TFI 002]